MSTFSRSDPLVLLYVTAIGEISDIRRPDFHFGEGIVVMTHIASRDPGMHIDAPPDGWGLIALTGELLRPPIVGMRMVHPISMFWRSPIWSLDSRTFTVMDYQGHIETRSVPTFALLPDAPSPEIPHSARFTFGVVWALGLQDDGRLLVVSQTRSTGEPTRLKLVSVGLSKGVLPPEVMPVAVPQQLILLSEALSPNRKQVLYFTVGREFWLSRADGSSLKRLGWIPQEYNREVLWDDGPKNIEWAPDSRHFSVIDKGVLYLIPTDLPGDPTSKATGG